MLTQVVQAVFTALSVGSMYALIAMGITLVYSATSIINFAQGEFVMLGGMVMVTLYGEMHWPLCLAVPIAVVVAVVVGMGLMKVAYRPGKSTSLISVFIIALGASLFISGSAGNVWDHSIHRYPPFSGEVPIQLFHATIMPQSLWIIGVTAALVVLLGLYFRFTMLGKAMRACAIDRTAASLMGIKAKRMVLLSFMMSLRPRGGRRHSDNAALDDEYRRWHAAGAQGLLRCNARRHGQHRGRGAGRLRLLFPRIVQRHLHPRRA